MRIARPEEFPRAFVEQDDRPKKVIAELAQWNQKGKASCLTGGRWTPINADWFSKLPTGGCHTAHWESLSTKDSPYLARRHCPMTASKVKKISHPTLKRSPGSHVPAMRLQRSFPDQAKERKRGAPSSQKRLSTQPSSCSTSSREARHIVHTRRSTLKGLCLYGGVFAMIRLCCGWFIIRDATVYGI